jgi:hypothetical protein
MADVKAGQVWADDDRRAAGRTIRVDAIEDGKAVCTILTNSTDAQELIDSWHFQGKTGTCPWAQDTRGRTTRIALSRLRPGSSGYRLVSDPEDSR